MRRTSTTPPGPEARARAGYSVLEMLIVLAIIALASAMVFPNAAAMADRVVAHAVFFDFERQMADLRREAYRGQTPLVVYPTHAAAGADPRGRTIALQAGWSYALDRPMAISAGGACAPASAELLDGSRPVMRLAAPDGDCRFFRVR